MGGRDILDAVKHQEKYGYASEGILWRVIIIGIEARERIGSLQSIQQMSWFTRPFPAQAIKLMGGLQDLHVCIDTT